MSDAVTFTDAERDAVGAILGRAIEPHSCAPGTAWHPAYTAWAKVVRIEDEEGASHVSE